jgi:Flp pilus assembly protein TadG
VGNLKTECDGRRRLAAVLGRRLTDGARDERGVVAIIFALAIVVLVPLVLGLFDVYTAMEQRARLQDAIDAAALYAARSELNTDTEINALAKKSLDANLRLIRGATLISSEFHLENNDTEVVGSATIQPLALAPAFWNHPSITVGTQVVRNSKNLEVSLVLDVTGSMNTGTRIADLRSAAQELVDIVVKDQQTPFYSKVAVVPWSSGVNLGSLADQARGPATPPTGVTAASWLEPTGKAISGASRSNPAEITAVGHGFHNGDGVYITGVKGMTELNGEVYTISNVKTNSFELEDVRSTYYNKYKSGGTVTKCLVSTCSLVVTSANHGFTNGRYVVATDMDGLTTALSAIGGNSTHNVSEYVYTVSHVTANTFALTEAVAPSGTYTNGGKVWCTAYGCKYFRFTNPSGTTKVYTASTCVSERTGAEKYTDTAPSTSYVGFHYPPNDAVKPTSSGDNPCLKNEVVPLSTDRTALKAMIGGLKAEGSTAGQIGTAWGWYMVSPNFGSLWPNASQRPAAYDLPNTIKAVVLMTDGALNTAFCDGVIAKDSPSGSGSNSDHNDCDATNGTTLNQSLALCSAMKAAGVVVYTVGFQITGDTTAETLMTNCATDAAHKYLPTSGSQLKEAFKAIGAELNNLRIAH